MCPTYRTENFLIRPVRSPVTPRGSRVTVELRRLGGLRPDHGAAPTSTRARPSAPGGRRRRGGRDRGRRASRRPAAEEVAAEGMMLSPRVRRHARPRRCTPTDPLLTPKIAQGFTTELINPDGLPAPVDASTRESGRPTCAGSRAPAPTSGPGRPSTSTSTARGRRGPRRRSCPRRATTRCGTS